VVDGALAEDAHQVIPGPGGEGAGLGKEHAQKALVVLGEQLDLPEGGGGFPGQADGLGGQRGTGRCLVAESFQEGREGIRGGQAGDVLAGEIDIGRVHEAASWNKYTVDEAQPITALRTEQARCGTNQGAETSGKRAVVWTVSARQEKAGAASQP
jgi:hypothetical protein